MAKVMNSFLLLLTGLSFLERSFYLFTQLASFAVALHLSRRRTNTRTHTGTPLQAYAYALCQTKIVHEGRGESAAQFETQQSYAVWYDAECQTWETHRSRCTGVGFICCCFFYSIIFPPPLFFLLLLNPPFTVVFSLLFELHKEKEVGLPYTTRIRIYITDSICLLQPTAA